MWTCRIYDMRKIGQVSFHLTDITLAFLVQSNKIDSLVNEVHHYLCYSLIVIRPLSADWLMIGQSWDNSWCEQFDNDIWNIFVFKSNRTF